MLTYDKMTALSVGSQDQLDGMGYYLIKVLAAGSIASTAINPPKKYQGKDPHNTARYV